MGVTFIISTLALLLWAISLVLRRKNHKIGIILAYVALALIVLAFILHFV